MSDLGQGDSEVPYVTVSPADGSTTAVLTVHAPDGTSTTVEATGGDLEPIPGTSPQLYKQRWSATTPVTYTQSGRWVLSWAVGGTGEGAEDLEVWVVAPPTAGGPTWTPGRSRVAAYVPHRSLERSLEATGDSGETYAWTFTSNTTPPAITVDRLIADGVAWVSARVSPLHASLNEAASVAAAVYAAAAVERGTPEGAESLQRANDLERRLDVLLRDLIDANNAANESGDFGVDIAPAPQWSFPPADCRWDSPTYW